MSHAWHDPASKSRTGIEILLHIFRNWQTGIARLRSGVSERKAGDQEFQAEVQEIAKSGISAGRASPYERGRRWRMGTAWNFQGRGQILRALILKPKKSVDAV
jgi:hypothetical protein